MEDFCEISKCSGLKMLENTGTKALVPMQVEEEEYNKENLDKMLAEHVDEEVLTPLTKINLKWRRKSAGLCISHSDMSGIALTKAKSTDTLATLRRTTSTPMAQTSLNGLKPSNLESLCGSSYQASSIEHASDHSSISPSPVVAPTKMPIHTTQRIKRNRLLVSQTPLRQILSKSIQKNLQEHGIYFRVQRKIPFSAMNSSDSSNNSCEQGSLSEASCAPLDLRTTPVLRRTQSDVTPERRAVIKSKTFEKMSPVSLMQNLSEELTESNKLVDSIHDNNLKEKSAFLSCQNENDTMNNSTKPTDCLTPATPKQLNTTEVWYTPQAFEPRKPFLKAMLRQKQEQENEERHSDEETNNQHEKMETNGGAGLKFWRLFNSVIKFTGVGNNGNGNEDEKKESPTKKNSLVKRAATFAGWIRSKSPEKRFKRPRQSSTSSQSRDSGEAVHTSVSPPLPSAKKYKSIHGRKPIQRLRKD